MSLQSFRDRYPGPWPVEETPSGYCVKTRCGTTICYVYVYSKEWQNVATTGRKLLTRAEGHAVAKAVAALADERSHLNRESS